MSASVVTLLKGKPCEAGNFGHSVPYSWHPDWDSARDSCLMGVSLNDVTQKREEEKNTFQFIFWYDAEPLNPDYNSTQETQWLHDQKCFRM